MNYGVVEVFYGEFILKDKKSEVLWLIWEKYIGVILRFKFGEWGMDRG